MDGTGQREFPRDRGSAELYEWVRTLVVTVLTVVLLFTFAARVMLVDGQSMRETLQNGDALLVLNAPYCGPIAEATS